MSLELDPRDFPLRETWIELRFVPTPEFIANQFAQIAPHFLRNLAWVKDVHVSLEDRFTIREDAKRLERERRPVSFQGRNQTEDQYVQVFSDRIVCNFLRLPGSPYTGFQQICKRTMAVFADFLEKAALMSCDSLAVGLLNMKEVRQTGIVRSPQEYFTISLQGQMGHLGLADEVRWQATFAASEPAGQLRIEFSVKEEAIEAMTKLQVVMCRFISLAGTPGETVPRDRDLAQYSDSLTKADQHLKTSWRQMFTRLGEAVFRTQGDASGSEAE
jgi:hypothetical protein